MSTKVFRAASWAKGLRGGKNGPLHFGRPLCPSHCNLKSFQKSRQDKQCTHNQYQLLYICEQREKVFNVPACFCWLPEAFEIIQINRDCGILAKCCITALMGSDDSSKVHFCSCGVAANKETILLISRSDVGMRMNYQYIPGAGAGEGQVDLDFVIRGKAQHIPKMLCPNWWHPKEIQSSSALPGVSSGKESHLKNIKCFLQSYVTTLEKSNVRRDRVFSEMVTKKGVSRPLEMASKVSRPIFKHVEMVFNRVCHRNGDSKLADIKDLDSGGIRTLVMNTALTGQHRNHAELTVCIIIIHSGGMLGHAGTSCMTNTAPPFISLSMHRGYYVPDLLEVRLRSVTVALEWHYRRLLPPPPTARRRLSWVRRLVSTKICSVPSRCSNIELVAVIATAQRPTSRRHPGPPSSGAILARPLVALAGRPSLGSDEPTAKRGEDPYLVNIVATLRGSLLDCRRPPPRRPPTPDYRALSAPSGLTWILSAGCPRNIRHQFCQRHRLPPPLLSSPLRCPTASSHKITQICKITG
ncbi:hypothetical protein B0H14DRAFT_2580433 [Mycena olivaceomarginata]|nr:hypothetical protein B0H14DRAFT_2580433 [Mycena olivaceomarginata]